MIELITRYNLLYLSQSTLMFNFVFVLVFKFFEVITYITLRWSYSMIILYTEKIYSHYNVERFTVCIRLHILLLLCTSSQSSEAFILYIYKGPTLPRDAHSNSWLFPRRIKNSKGWTGPRKWSAGNRADEEIASWQKSIPTQRQSEIRNKRYYSIR